MSTPHCTWDIMCLHHFASLNSNSGRKFKVLQMLDVETHSVIFTVLPYKSWDS